MGYYTDDVYYQPEAFGLTLLGEVSWDDESYQFDYTIVLRDDATGELFHASDSGCSCPSPFEDYTSREQLTPVDGWAELEALLRERAAEADESLWRYAGPNRDEMNVRITDLIQKVRAAS